MNDESHNEEVIMILFCMYLTLDAVNVAVYNNYVTARHVLPKRDAQVLFGLQFGRIGGATAVL